MFVPEWTSQLQDIALFLPTVGGSSESSGGTVFLAFHVNCPNRYLSEESINTARQDLGPSPAYILGRIILVEQHVATEVRHLLALPACCGLGWVGLYF